MKGNRLYALTLLVIGITLLKLFMPQQTAALRDELRRRIDPKADFSQTIQEVSNFLSRGKDETAEVLSEEASVSENALPAAATETMESHATAQLEPSPTPIPSPSPTPQPSPTPEAVTTFLEKQAEFDGHALPANVSAEMPQLPFSYSSPVNGHDSSGFGYRIHPIYGEVKYHYGTDFAANSGEDVLAFADGYVYAAGCDAGYGNYLILTHDGGYSTIYAHMSEFVAHEGQTVKRGDVIGKVGATGNATGPHLHFELLCGETYYNPEYYI